MNETSKAIARRLHDPRFITRYFTGDGIDIGSGPDPLSRHMHLFPLMRSCRSWDKRDGDAQTMPGIEQATFDFVHSSHCLEDLTDPLEALASWVRICKSGGHLIITVPDGALYEQGVWPSTFNPAHKHRFSIAGLIALLTQLGADIVKVELLDHAYKYDTYRQDQTLGISESAIEMILRKR